MARVRSAAQRAPQTVEQATALLARFADASAQIDALEAQRAASLAQINGAADACIVPLAAELKDIAKQLKPWWAASIEELTAGRRKSIELGGCTIGYRISPPKVVHEHGKDGDAALKLLGTDYAERGVRISYALDKPGILKVLDEQAALEGDAVPEMSLASLGFASKQAEEFFIDVIAPQPIVSAAGDGMSNA